MTSIFKQMTMKKIYLCVFGLICLIPLFSQVGINTKFPQGVFHVDPLGNTSSTGTAGFADDILVTKDGSIGIGTLNPSSHVHIDKGAANSFIRIEDTSEGTGDKFLASDSEGRGSWIPAITLNGKVYRMNSPGKTAVICNYNVNTVVPFNLVKEDNGTLSSNPTPGVLTIQADGTYVFNFRWWGSINGGTTVVSDAFFTPKAYVRLYRITVSGGAPVISGNPVDEILVFDRVRTDVGTGTFRRSTFITSLYGIDLKKGDLYAITVTPADNSGITWQMGQSLAAAQYPNIIYFPSVAVYNI